MSVHDVAAYLNVPVRWVYQRVQRNEIPHRRLGKHLRFEREPLSQWLQQR
jgi:excisionase family DNA binding protein